MAKIISKKGPKRKYKRFAAALAGAAVISSTLLPGIPVLKVHAAESNQVNAAPVTSEERVAVQNSPLKTARQQASKYGFDTEHDKFSLQHRTDTEATVIIRTASGKIYKMELTKTRGNDWRVTSVRPIGNDSANTVSTPVKEVMDNAYRFGFNADTDKFSLLSLTGNKATVQVQTSGQTFKVDLTKKYNGWEITTIRGVGSSKYPATYIPASMFPYTNLLPKPVPNIGQSKILFESDQYNGWSWLENSYPSDRTFGILLQDPRTNETIDLYPSSVLNALDNIDFSKQFVLYTSLGTVSSQGYGIGIERILQTGNDYTVTVRTKSPAVGAASLPTTKSTDLVTIDRSTLDFSDPVTITFVDANGVTLSKYTLTLRY